MLVHQNGKRPQLPLKQQIVQWFMRVVPRAVIGLLLTSVAFSLVRTLTVWSDIPEVMAALMAIALYAWMRFSVWAVRLFLQPQLDMQQLGMLAGFGAGSAVVFVAMMIESVAGCVMIMVMYLHALAIMGGG